MMVASSHIVPRFAGRSPPVYVRTLSSSMRIRSRIILRCCSTKPTVGAVMTIFDMPDSSAAAIQFHWTAVLPKPVGITSSVEPDMACLAANNWYALASTPSQRRGWDSTGVICESVRRWLKRICMGDASISVSTTMLEDCQLPSEPSGPMQRS